MGTEGLFFNQSHRSEFLVYLDAFAQIEHRIAAI